jgi:protein-tyrosine-phosphatase/predicted ATP-grasp superfamily ATP-dependent carboligase
MPRPILIFNAVEHVQLAVARSLHQHGIDVTIADITGSGSAPSPSRAIARCVNLPNSNDTPEQFVDALTELIRIGGYDMVIPCGDPGLVAVSQCYEQLSRLLYVGCPPPHIVSRVLHKNLTLEAAAKCNIAIPVTHNIRDEAELERMRDQLRFPIIAKPASKIDERLHTFKLRFFQSFEDLADAFRTVPRFGSLHLLQEYCAGVGVGIEVLIHKGLPVALFQHRRLKELPITGGGSVMAISERLAPALADQAVTLLREIGWEGPAMVEFRYDQLQNKATLMEINGRYWGSLPLAIRAGMNFPLYEWQIAHSEELTVAKSYRYGLRTRWLAGDVLRLRSLFTDPATDGFPRPSKSTELIRFIKDCSPTIVPAVWSWTDPVPAVLQFRATVKPVITAVLRRMVRSFPAKSFGLDKYRYLGWRNSRFFMQQRLLHLAGVKRYLPPRNLDNVRKVLFVCHGNILRSPMAAALLRRSLASADGSARIEVLSAGLIEKPQTQPDSRAIEAANELGISLDRHRPQGLTQQLVADADVILVMDRLNEARMLAAYPDATAKMFLLGSLSNESTNYVSAEISDPGLGDIDEVRRCYRVLEVQIQILADMLAIKSPS